MKRGKSIIKIGANSNKTHPKFARIYKSGDVGYCLHAEMNVLRFAQPGDEITVLRWKADGTLSMSKPCPACMGFIERAGIRKLTYSDWNGELQTLKVG